MLPTSDLTSSDAPAATVAQHAHCEVTNLVCWPYFEDLLAIHLKDELVIAHDVSL